MATVTDYVRVTENLALSYQKDSADNLFDPYCDAFLAHCEEVSENDNGGAGFVVQCVTRGNVNSNPTFALAGLGAPGRFQVTLQPVNLEFKARWTRDAQLGAESKGPKAMFNLAKQEIDIAINSAKQDLAKELGGKGWGALAGIVAISGSTVTVGQPDGNAAGAAVPELLNRFWPGQILVAADAESTGELRGSTPGDRLTVVSYDPATGIMTMSAAIGTTAWADGDYLFEYGYRNFDAASGRKCMVGAEGWLSDQDIGSFDRSANPGSEPLTYDANNDATIFDGLIAAEAQYYSFGKCKEGLAIFCHPKQFRKMTQSVEARAQVVKGGVTRTNSKGEEYTIGYSEFGLTGLCGHIPIIPSALAVRPDMAFLGPFKSKKYGFKLMYAGDSIFNLTKDPQGNSIFYIQAGLANNSSVTEAGYGVDGFFRGNLLCKHPGNYMVISNLDE